MTPLRLFISASIESHLDKSGDIGALSKHKQLARCVASTSDVE